MSKLTDDLIQSLKEAVDHAKGKGRCTEHSPDNAPGAEGTDDEADQLRVTGLARQSERVSPRKSM